ncbi:MAG: beta-ketoacyl-[acyl-carrier-protein] synthase family protein [Deltaproteobacteria bacterium]|nr:beta-ketoacyl-[acyl-carrier-protein] synthase family protein [Deltaproteobacteria bacterium]
MDRYYAGVASCIEGLEQGGNRSLVYELIDRVLENTGIVPSDTFLITASTKAGIDRIVDSVKKPPSDYSDSFPQHIADYICDRFSLSGETLHISAACASSTVAIARGAALIKSGRYDSVLICCYDLVTEFVFSGFCSLQAMSPAACKPFDKNRKGMSIGEGAATLLLMNEKKARELGKKTMGIISGWAVTNDATHITRPDKDGCGLALAIEKSALMAGINTDSISAICAHGTGTLYNDSMELAAYKNVFGSRNIPVFSVKGAIGHTLGAAGGIEAAVSLKCLMHGVIPPTTGFTDPDPDAAGLVSSGPVKTDIRCILSTNSGFAGVNASVIMERG